MSFPTHIVAVGGIVEDGNGNILLVKTRDGGWVYPGGQIEVGENLVDGLIREITEESGIDVSVSHLIGIFSNTGIHKWYDEVTDVPTKVMFDFVCKPVGGQLDTSDETTDSRWVPKENVLDLITAPAIRTRYEAYLSFNGSVNYMEYDTPSKSECTVKLERQV
ncbi:NUDIX hydrolase [Ferroacidibacillus organovorans]|uniref:ADP-ribose pyrophosphatase n=1 Tax=Ferroacidibacillus organovorans TaxID=1765683 RepID=A0A853K709_9BACL|nr:NUDIX hydrolase [Ferroacidibacillus organovorans]KYP79261.1 ADP-ribose pyrophosphatase [Ferroacidibacillus organovorans]OAG87904.1 ADP-ribose pyrophosphatase [Ferroacidibacillus organovorans]